MNFFKLYIGDYQRDTGTLTLAEHGAYALMLQYFYATEAPLPTGRDLHRLLRADTPAERKAIDAVAARFWHETDDGLINDRALEEIRKGSHQRDVNREIGARGGRPKKTESVSESVSKTATESKTESVSESVPKSEPNRNPNHSQTPEINTPPIPPTPPDGDAVGAGPKKRTRSPAVAIGTWIEAVKARGELPIPADDPVFDYAEKAGIPTEYVYLAWREFQAKNTGGAKRYSDWRQAFRNCVRGSWYGLWYAKPDGDYALTTKGIQAQRVFDAAPKLEAVA